MSPTIRTDQAHCLTGTAAFLAVPHLSLSLLEKHGLDLKSDSAVLTVLKRGFDLWCAADVVCKCGWLMQGQNTCNGMRGYVAALGLQDWGPSTACTACIST
jgi:hypothetical protein